MGIAVRSTGAAHLPSPATHAPPQRCLSRTQRPKRRPKKPLLVEEAEDAEDAEDADDAEEAWPGQRWVVGTDRMTWSTCWPQPAQVVLPQLLQVAGRHMGVLL
jgi:hypothetical protein